MGKQIRITIDTKKINIDSDTPDFSELVSIVIEKQDFDFKAIIVECEDEKFDTESFKDALVSVIESTLKQISLESEKLEESLSKIKEEKEKLSK